MLRSLCAYHIVPALSICVRVSKAYVTGGITSVSLFSLGWLNSTVCRVCQDNNNQISVTSSVCQAAFGWTLSISTTDVLLSNSSQSAQKAGLQFFSHHCYKPGHYFLFWSPAEGIFFPVEAQPVLVCVRQLWFMSSPLGLLHRTGSAMRCDGMTMESSPP